MGDYVFRRGGETPAQFLARRSFSSDITAATREVKLEVARNTRSAISSVEELNARGIRVSENIRAEIARLRDDLRGSTDALVWRLDDVSRGVQELGVTFHWGFTEILSSLGRLGDTLDDLRRLARTPAQTWAYEQYDIARDAMRRGLYPEALVSLDRAINGKGDHVGYALDFRFHQARGLILIGSASNCIPELLDYAAAEASFLAAVRYALSDYPEDAARAAMCAGHAAYCRGNVTDGITHTRQALELNSELGEARFQFAKFQMHLDKPDVALAALREALRIDDQYLLKAAADGDFQKHKVQFDSFVESLRSESRRIARSYLADAEPWIQQMTEWEAFRSDPDSARSAIDGINAAKQCISRGGYYDFEKASELAKRARDTARLATMRRENYLRHDWEEMVRLDKFYDQAKFICEHAPSAFAAAERAFDEACKKRTAGKTYSELDSDLNRFREAWSARYHAFQLACARDTKVKEIRAHNNKDSTWVEGNGVPQRKGCVTIIAVGIMLELGFILWNESNPRRENAGWALWMVAIGIPVVSISIPYVAAALEAILGQKRNPPKD